MRPPLSHDRDGLEGLPLKLLMTSLVVALSAPALGGAIGYLGYTSEVSIAAGQAHDIRAAASSAFVGGPGNIRTVSIDLPPNCSIRLGGQDIGAVHMIEVLWHGGVAATVELDEPSLRILTMDGGQLRLEGSLRLELRCLVHDGSTIIRAEVA